jgi:hypothetical protein
VLKFAVTETSFAGIVNVAGVPLKDGMPETVHETNSCPLGTVAVTVIVVPIMPEVGEAVPPVTYTL